MAKSARLRTEDVRAAMRVVGECRDLGHDPAAWRLRACEGLVRLLGGRMANDLECRWLRPGGPIRPIDFHQSGLTPDEYRRFIVPFFARAAPDEDDVVFGPLKAAPGRHVVLTRRQSIPDAAWYRCPTYTGYFQLAGMDDCLTGVLELPGGPVDMMAVHRPAGDRDFDPREVRLFTLFHAELGSLIGPVLVAADDEYSPTRLPPRVREVLTCLLDGDGEKQAAARLGISRATAHQYVTALYRHYRVGSRAELLVRVLRRPTPPGGAEPGR